MVFFKTETCWIIVLQTTCSLPNFHKFTPVFTVWSPTEETWLKQPQSDTHEINQLRPIDLGTQIRMTPGVAYKSCRGTTVNSICQHTWGSARDQCIH